MGREPEILAQSGEKHLTFTEWCESMNKANPKFYLTPFRLKLIQHNEYVDNIARKMSLT